MRLALALSLLLVASPALALEGRLVPVSGTDKYVIVWRSKASMDEGLAMLRAQADSKLILPLTSCAPTKGTRAVHSGQSEGSMFSGYALAIVVIEGPRAGCRGVVALKEFVFK